MEQMRSEYQVDLFSWLTAKGFTRIDAAGWKWSDGKSTAYVGYSSRTWRVTISR